MATQTENANPRIPEFAEALRQCLDYIDQAVTVVITVHVNADGDAIGSQLGMAGLLRALGKTVHCINPDELPANLRFLAGSSAIRDYDAEGLPGIPAATDTIFILDVNDPARLGSLCQAVLDSPARKIVIDHHMDPKAFADCYLVDTDACATGLLIARLLDYLPDGLLDDAVAEALYTAILTDTGGFRFPRTNPEVHRITARLIEAGADPVSVYENVYNDFTPERMRLMGQALARIRTCHNGRLAIMPVTAEMLSPLADTRKATEGFVNYTLALRGVEMGILAVESEEGIKMSLRSKGNIPVNKLAATFGGGGHINAAGARTRDFTMEELIEELHTRALAYLPE